MQIITLTSDWGTKDHYLALLKAQILSVIPDVRIIDITHDVNPFNLRQASYILKNCYQGFPSGTVHYIGMGGLGNETAKLILVSYKEHHFLGVDSGIFSLIFDETPDTIIEISHEESVEKKKDSYFRLVTETIKRIERGDDGASLGEPKDELARQLHFKPVVSGDSIRGLVIYIDNYDNVVTNITRDIFEEVQDQRPFSIECRGEEITRISESYGNVTVGEIVALFNQAGHLEIAINLGNASGLLGLSVDDPVSVRFK